MPNLWYNTRTKDDLIHPKAGKSLVVFIGKNFGGTLSMRKSLRTSALCLGLTGLMILSAGCATRNKPGTAATTPANETTGDISSSAAVADTANDGEQGVSEPDKVKLAEAPNGFVSLLNVVEFGKNNFDEAKISFLSSKNGKVVTVHSALARQVAKRLETDSRVFSYQVDVPLTNVPETISVLGLRDAFTARFI